MTMGTNDESFYRNRTRLDAAERKVERAKRDLVDAERELDEIKRSGVWNWGDSSGSAGLA